MTDATILIPTHRHSALLPWALRSALAQEEISVEVLVVGDGVDDDMREAVAPFLDDVRVRFFDNPKGTRHGEAHRHAALEQASGSIVCYLSDDDLLLPDHAVQMKELLVDADLAQSAPVFVHTDGTIRYDPIDLGWPQFRDRMLNERWNRVGLTGAAHTLSAYRRLPAGWRPAPADIWTDLHMWRQFLELPGFRGRTGARVTALHFPASHRSRERDDRELVEWWTRSQEPGFGEQLEQELAEAIRQRALTLEKQKHYLERQLQVVAATRTWRLHERLVRFRTLRALLARSHAAR